MFPTFSHLLAYLTGYQLVSVFPTSLYEAIICILLFAFLWMIKENIELIMGIAGSIWSLQNYKNRKADA